MSDKQPEALRLADALDQDFAADRTDFDNIQNAAGELRRLHALNAELVEALGRLLASHKDYTESQQEGWPENKAHGYPDLRWSLEIEEHASAALSKAKEQ